MISNLRFLLTLSFDLLLVYQDSPDSVRLLSVAVSIFGPRMIVRELAFNEGNSYFHNDGMDGDLDAENFLKVFKDIFIPWCLQGNIDNSSTDAQLDLILALLDTESFVEQWDMVITYATNLSHGLVGPEPCPLSFKKIAVLARLMEKARAKMRNMQGEVSQWHHKLLDSTALYVARSLPPFAISGARFLRAVLGGSTYDDQISLLSRDVTALIFEEILKKLLAFLIDSSFTLVRDAASHLKAGSLHSSVDMLQVSQFDLEVLEGSFFCLKTFLDESKLLPSISAAMFLITWEFGMLKTLKGAKDANSVEKLMARWDFGESVNALLCRINNNQFWKTLSICTRHNLTNFLIRSIRSIIFKEDALSTDKIVSLCCIWVLEVFEFLCQDECEKQSLLDQLLGNDESWPVWVMQDTNTSERLAIVKIDNVTADMNVRFSFSLVFPFLIL